MLRASCVSLSKLLLSPHLHLPVQKEGQSCCKDTFENTNSEQLGSSWTHLLASLMWLLYPNNPRTGIIKALCSASTYYGGIDSLRRCSWVFSTVISWHAFAPGPSFSSFCSHPGFLAFHGLFSCSPWFLQLPSYRHWHDSGLQTLLTLSVKPLIQQTRGIFILCEAAQCRDPLASANPASFGTEGNTDTSALHST